MMRIRCVLCFHHLVKMKNYFALKGFLEGGGGLQGDGNWGGGHKYIHTPSLCMYDMCM